MSSIPRTRTFAALAACALVVVALCVWFARAEDRDTQSLTRAGDTSGERTTSRELERSAGDAVLQPSAGAARVSPVEVEAHTEAAQAPGELSTAVSDAPEPLVTLLGKFAQPDDGELLVEHATVALVAAHGATRTAQLTHARSFVFEGLARGVYTVRVESAGFVHREQVLDLATLSRTFPAPELREHEGPVFTELIVLWPASWVAVVVRTSRGEPFSALADALGVLPVELFVGAFDASAQTLPPVDDAWPPHDASLATFRIPPAYKQWELPGACAGSLELKHAPPLWLGLRVFGTPLGWQLVAPETREVVFVVDEAVLTARLGRVRVRVLDRASQKPALDARVTLIANTSAYRRRTQHDVAPEPDGSVTFERVVPCRYELSIERGGSLVQRLLEVHAAESVDAGEVSIGAEHTVRLRIVDERGEPVYAGVQIGPYERGARVKNLYPPMTSRQTDENGFVALQVPEAISIVRAQRRDPETNRTLREETANALFDPAHLPPSDWTLVVRPIVHATGRVLTDAASALEIVDELGLVVYATTLRGRGGMALQLVAGRYDVRLLDDARKVLAQTELDATREPAEFTLP